MAWTSAIVLPSNVISLNRESPVVSAYVDIAVTLLGIDRLVKSEYYMNLSPRLVTFCPSVTLDNFGQYAKASAPMLVTVSGTTMVSTLSPWNNAPCAMLVTPRPISIETALTQFGIWNLTSSPVS